MTSRHMSDARRDADSAVRPPARLPRAPAARGPAQDSGGGNAWRLTTVESVFQSPKAAGADVPGRRRDADATIDGVPERLPDAERAIARSVLYAALFDYPLTLAQLRDTLIESTQTPSEILAACARSAALREIVEYRDGFVLPRGAAHLVRERLRREGASRRFLESHRRFIVWLCHLPYLRMAALSGSVAHLNLDGDGDLDLFLVARRGRVWSVTVATVLLAKLFGCRPTVCANFVVADSRLALEPADLFSASQILHLKPLAGAAVHRRLLAENPFVRRFYPGWPGPAAGTAAFEPGPRAALVKRIVERIGAAPSLLLERLCRAAYGRYLRRRAGSWASPEQVRLEPDCLKLHTQSHRQSVLARFDEAVQRAIDR
jgi:hypothetical protein